MKKQSFVPRVVVCLAFLFSAAAFGQGIEETAEQYKRVHQDIIRLLLEGDTAKALEELNAFGEKYPLDRETPLVKAMVYAEEGDFMNALAQLQTALQMDLPQGRIYAEANNLLAPLAQNPNVGRRVFSEGPLLVHGPMVGKLTPESVAVWVRTWPEVEVTVEIAKSGGFETIVTSETGQTRAENDFTAVCDLGGLEPDTEYHYRVIVEGDLADPFGTGVFRTAPRDDRSAAFTIGFGGGAGFVPWNERIWDAVNARDPLAFFFLGDNIYSDAPELRELQRYCYYRRQSRPEYREFVSHTPIFAVWDDHDFSVNDSAGGPEPEEPAWKPDVWEVFRENWVNPRYGGGEGVYGCWFKASIADVDFFMLDSRYYRTETDIANPSMLGPVQKKWLLEALAESDATFKVIASPVPMVKGTKGGSDDTWDGFPDEREEILSFVKDNELDGVFVIAADRHRSDVWRMEREGTYDLIEFESSRLTNQHVHGEQPGSLFSYNEKQSFGLLHFDTTRNDPRVTYEIVNIDGESVYEYSASLSELTHPLP